MKGKKYSTDVVIIGAGPIGLFGVFVCGTLQMKCHVIDILDYGGGQCAALYPEKFIYDIPGHKRIKAIEFIENLKEQNSQFNPVYHFGQKVETIKKVNGSWKVKTSIGSEIKAKAIIIAAGNGSFCPIRPNINDISSYEDKCIFYSIKDKEIFKGKKIVIVGGGNSAVDWALDLVNVAKKVTLVHRRNKFKALPENVEKLKTLDVNGQIDLMIPYQLDGVNGQNGNLVSVVFKDLEGEKIDVDADILLPFYGLSMNLGPIKEWGIKLIEDKILIEPNSGKTNIKGVFAAGDVATYENKIKLILTGFSEVTYASYSIRKELYSESTFNFKYSSSKKF